MWKKYLNMKNSNIKTKMIMNSDLATIYFLKTLSNSNLFVWVIHAPALSH